MTWRFAITVSAPRPEQSDDVIVPLPAWVDEERAIAAARAVLCGVIGAGAVRVLRFDETPGRDAVIWDSTEEQQRSAAGGAHA